MQDPDVLKEKRKKERFFQKVRERNYERKELVKIAVKYAYYVIFVAVLSCGVACAASWLLVFNYEDDLKPYNILFWMFAVIMSTIVVCTALCTYCAIRQEYFKMYYFVNFVLWFAFCALIVSCCGLIVLKYNVSIPFYKISGDTMKGVLIWGFFGGGMVAFLFLFLSAYYGARVSNLSKDNFFNKRIKAQCLPELKTDMTKLQEEADARKQKRLDDLPKAGMYDDDLADYHQSFTGVLDLQKGKNEFDEKDFWTPFDIMTAVPDLPHGAVEYSADNAVDFVPAIKDRPCRGRLLPSKQMLSEGFFNDTWATALALALLQKKLPDWCDEPAQAKLVRSGLKKESQVKIFERVVQSISNELEAEWIKVNEAKSAKKPNGTAAGVGMPEDVALDVEEEPLSADQKEDEVNESVRWIEPVRNGMIFLNNRLHKQRDASPDIRSTAPDWLAVAGLVVSDWLSKKKKV